jgi:serine/threonine protein kinase
LSTPVSRINKAFSKGIALICILADIKSDNILQEIEDKSILESFTQAELESPSPRKIVNGLPVYASRCFDLPKVFGRAVLSDFGSAVQGDEKRNHDAQPDVYRSPEVMLKTDWSYPVDIWNVGVMVCFPCSLFSLSISCTNHSGIIGVGFV